MLILTNFTNCKESFLLVQLIQLVEDLPLLFLGIDSTWVAAN